MEYVKRQVDLGDGPEVVYVFAPPLEALSDVFAVDVRRSGEEIRESMNEVLDYEYDSAFFNGSVYEFAVYRDVTFIDRVYAEGGGTLAEVDTQHLYRLIGSYLRDNGIDTPIADWEKEENWD